MARPTTALLLPLAACILIAGQAPARAANHEIPLEDREVELETLRSRIRDVQHELDAARGEVETYRADLKQQEMAIARITENLETLERDIAGQRSQVADVIRETLQLERIDIDHGRAQ